MKSLLLAAALIVAPIAADAADLASKTTAVPTPTTTVNWSGGYIGAVLGAGFDRTKLYDSYVEENYSYSATSLNGGVEAGYNWQVSSFVFGAVLDFSFSGYRKNVWEYSDELHHKTSSDWFSTIRGRAGIAFDNWLVYGTAGVAFVDTRHSSEWPYSSDTCGVTDYYTSCVKKTNVGLAIGAGVEAMITKSWSVKLEYLHLAMPTTHTTDASNYTYSWNDSADIVRAGIAYHF